jgi:hypothetical protein
VVGWLAWKTAGGIYFNRRAALAERIAQLSGDVQKCRTGLDDHARVVAALRQYADRTLGGDLETVDHRLRSRLNRIGEEVGIAGLTVGTGRSRKLQSPAKSQFSIRGQRALREELDGVEVEGWISGRGAFEQVLRLVHRVEAEPWLKRVHQVRVQPKENGKLYEVSLRLNTLYLPDRAPQEAAGGPYDPSGFDAYASLVKRDPFRIPAAPAPQPPLAARAVKPPFPYHQWVLTGVASARDGTEVWLLNRATGESRRLSAGEALQGLTLMSASGDTAEFRFKDETFTVVVGGHLAPGGK